MTRVVQSSEWRQMHQTFTTFMEICNPRKCTNEHPSIKSKPFPVNLQAWKIYQLWWANKYNMKVLYRGLDFKFMDENLSRNKVHNFMYNHIIDIRDLEYEHLLCEAGLNQSSESWYEISVCHTELQTKQPHHKFLA